MAPSLIPCVACGCHVKSTDPACPGCGEPIRRGESAVQRSAVAVLMGLTAAGAFAASCSSTGPVVSQSGTSSGTGGADTTTYTGGGVLYGIATGTSTGASSSSSGGVPVLYGPAMTTSSSSGTGGSSTGNDDGGTADGG